MNRAIISNTKVRDILNLLIDCGVVFHFDIGQEICLHSDDDVLLEPFLDFLVESIDPRENSLLHINILLSKSCPIKA